MNREALRLLDELVEALDNQGRWASAAISNWRADERASEAGEAVEKAHQALRALLSAQEDDVCGVPNWAVVKAFIEHSQTPETMHACYPDRAPDFIGKVMRRAGELAKQEAK
jgi:hypothetical protein